MGSLPESDGFDVTDVSFGECGQVCSKKPGTKRPRFTLYIMDISYFSGKLEAYIRYRRIPHRRVNVTQEQMGSLLLPKTGLMQVPILHDGDNNEWLRDTSSIIALFETLGQGLLNDNTILKWPVVPPLATKTSGDGLACYFRFANLLLEDYFDEWMWTPALFYRWEFRLDAGNLARRFIYHDFASKTTLPAPQSLMELVLVDRQYQEYVVNAGVRDQAGKCMMEDIYKLTLARLEAFFVTSGQPFLMGPRPSIADFGLFASMFRHFSLDPTPSKIMRLTAPGVFAWCSRMWNASTLDGANSGDSDDAYADSGIHEMLEPILADAVDSYLPYLMANAQAIVDGKLSLDYARLKRVEVSPFRAWCGLQLIKRFEELSDAGKAQILQDKTLGKASVKNLVQARALFQEAASHWCGIEKGSEPPRCQAFPESEQSILSKALGTANHNVRSASLASALRTPLSRTLAVVFLLCLGSATYSRRARTWWAISLVTLVAYSKLRAKYI